MKGEYAVNRSGTLSYNTGNNNVKKVPSLRGTPLYGGRNYVQNEMGFRVALFVR